MSLVSYQQARSWANEIAAATAQKSMPPWFADPSIGHFANDPSLTAEQIATLSAWAKAKGFGGAEASSTS